MFSTGTGILMAVFMNNAGGAWDNAKKYIEGGAFGGKGSEEHKCAVTGDTVGDPCKDVIIFTFSLIIEKINELLLLILLVFVKLFLIGI